MKFKITLSLLIISFFLAIIAAPAAAILGDPRPCEGDCSVVEDETPDLETAIEEEVEPVTSDPNDLDGDGISNDLDNCPTIANEDQFDTDEDGSGDACDGDDDGDLIIDRLDICPYEYAPDTDDGCPINSVIADEPELVLEDNLIQSNQTGPNLGEALDNGACSFLGNSKGSNVFVLVLFGLILLPLVIRRKI
ncbi:MAG: thrombospondin type 3 repeat-containing protein [Pseudomonadota bacterium]